MAPRSSSTSGSRPPAPPALAVHALKDRRPVARPGSRGRRDRRWSPARRPLSVDASRVARTRESPRTISSSSRSARSGRQPVLVASGWIYPTDSSINVAIAQGGHRAARPVARSAEHGRSWVVRRRPRLPGWQEQDHPDRLERDRRRLRARLRLRTNLEIYWDFAGAGGSRAARDGEDHATRAATAELRYRGFS